MSSYALYSEKVIVRNGLNVEDNGVADALTDGLLIMRRIAGMSGDALIAGVVASDCDVCAANAIQTAIDQGIAGEVLKMDSDSDTDIDDGIIILRYLFGFRGAALIDGVCPGCDATTIAAKLAPMMR